VPFIEHLPEYTALEDEEGRRAAFAKFVKRQRVFGSITLLLQSFTAYRNVFGRLQGLKMEVRQQVKSAKNQCEIIATANETQNLNANATKTGTENESGTVTRIKNVIVNETVTGTEIEGEIMRGMAAARDTIIVTRITKSMAEVSGIGTRTKTWKRTGTGRRTENRTGQSMDGMIGTIGGRIEGKIVVTERGTKGILGTGMSHPRAMFGNEVVPCTRKKWGKRGMQRTDFLMTASRR
jgi:hypothetical protein